MDSDERQIYHYLKFRKQDFSPFRDICRDVGGKRKSRYSPEWARPVLDEMVKRGILVTDGKDAYRLKPIPAIETQGKAWTSPKIASILKESGKDFQSRMRGEDEDEYYDKL